MTATNPRHEEIRQRFAAGEDRHALAAEFDMRPASISRIVRGIAPPTRQSEHDAVAKIRECAAQGMTRYMINHRAGISVERVDRLCEQYGITLCASVRAPRRSLESSLQGDSPKLRAERDRVDSLMRQRGGYQDDPHAIQREGRFIANRGDRSGLRSSADFL